MAKQTEFQNLPEADPLAIACSEYLNQKDKVDREKDELALLKDKVMNEFEKTNRKKAMVAGRVFTYSSSTKRQIKVQ